MKHRKRNSGIQPRKNDLQGADDSLLSLAKHYASFARDNGLEPGVGEPEMVCENWNGWTNRPAIHSIT